MIGINPALKDWHATQGSTALALATPVLIQTKGGAGVRHHLSGLQVSNLHATKPVHVTILDGVRTPVNFGTVADASALAALTGMQAGDVAYRLDNTTWYYYVSGWTTCVAHVPVVLPAVANAAALGALATMGKGDVVFETDINVWYYYGTSWVVCGIVGTNQIYNDYLPAMTATLPLERLDLNFDPPLKCSENKDLLIQIDDTATVFWNAQGFDEPNTSPPI